jgi:hypothetical protein
MHGGSAATGLGILIEKKLEETGFGLQLLLPRIADTPIDIVQCSCDFTTTLRALMLQDFGK